MNHAMRRMEVFLDNIEKYLISTAILMIIIIMFINVIGRYIFLHSLSWADEISRYLNIWAVYVGVSTGVKKSIHIGVSAFVDLVLSSKLKKVVSIIVDIVSLCFCVFVIYYGYKLSIAQFAMKQLSPAMRLPIGLVYAAIPMGMFLSSIRYVQRIFSKVIEGGKDAQ